LAAKSELLARLALEQSRWALDVGCGLGTDVFAMAERLAPGGHAVGLDASETMIAEATTRVADAGLDVRFLVGDALALPFDDATFDACRVETVLQHLVDPRTAVREMTRVTRPGGRVGAIEFDLETVFLDHPDQELSETIRETFLAGAVQGAIGRQLPRLFRRAGLVDIQATAHTVLSDPAFFRLLVGRQVDALCEQRTITRAQADGWWSEIDAADAAGHFTAGATMFVVAATRPPADRRADAGASR
jgi:ubiquinone/menaquinone biosynthesis C-methylase UbiE